MPYAGCAERRTMPNAIIEWPRWTPLAQQEAPLPYVRSAAPLCEKPLHPYVRSPAPLYEKPLSPM